MLQFSIKSYNKKGSKHMKIHGFGTTQRPVTTGECIGAFSHIYVIMN